MIPKPKHLTWTNLSEIYKKELVNEPIFYTWKADGYFTKITFTLNQIYFKIYNKEKTILFKDIHNIDLTLLNDHLRYKCLSDITIYGEFMSAQFYRFSRHKIFIFDLSIQHQQLNFWIRYNILDILLSKIIFIENNCNLVLELKKCSRYKIPLINFNYSYNRFKDNNFDYQYQDSCYAKCDGIIIHEKSSNRCFKVKYQNTLDLWLETISGKLYTEDLVFMGYIGPSDNLIIGFNDVPFKLVEVYKYCHSIYYKLLKYRNDKKRADTYLVASNIDAINPRLLSSYFVNLSLRHLPKIKINHSNLLTFEFRILKEEILLLTLQILNYSKVKSIRWLDIGCGSGHELSSFICLRNKNKNKNKLFVQDIIYLCDLYISPTLKQHKNNILQQHENIKNIKLVNQDIYNTKIKDEIPKNSFDMITLFLSITDLNDKLFQNLDYILSPSGKIAIIFYDTTHLSKEGLFNISYNFGLKAISKSKIKVYRNKNPKWIIEERLDIDKVINSFKKYNYRKIAIINKESLDKLDPFSEMLYGIIFTKYFNNHKLQDLMHIDIIQYKIRQSLLSKDLMNLKIIFPMVNWINKNISKDNLNRNSSQLKSVLPIDQNILDNIESLNNIHHSSDDSFDSASDNGYYS